MVGVVCHPTLAQNHTHGESENDVTSAQTDDDSNAMIPRPPLKRGRGTVFLSRP